jgi:glycosyltransferase A (GT-A) superfamily protein (DUF2064 family)
LSTYHDESKPQPVLVLLCKRPALGHSKQRLAAQIGLKPGLRIAEKLLQCALEDLQHWSTLKVIAVDHPKHLAWAQACCPNAIAVAQNPGNLGQRIKGLDCHLREQGHGHLIFIGSDCPALDRPHYRRVNQLLRVHDTVLIAAGDGGVVLMASKRPWPELDDLPWSTAALGEALMQRCQQTGHSVVVADMLWDVDHREDLLGLPRFLEHDRRPGRRALLNSLSKLGLHHHASQ